jgi:putative restriction endonuclease
MPDRHYGSIEGVPEGTTFPDRRAVAHAGVHRPPQAGISGSRTDGADSIVVSGGYVDDQDNGDVLIYTGQGGNDPDSGRQIADQELTRGNAGLVISCEEGLPIRVVRGSGGDPAFAPASGYRYDGLYRVESYWPDSGRDGFRIWRFRLEKIGVELHPETEGPTPTERAETTIQRIVRNTAHAIRVKELHDFTCQVCGVRIATPRGEYAEGAHIRPLGEPHNGPDELDNILCLCPNHHVMLDRLAIYIDDRQRVRLSSDHSDLGPLRKARRHLLNEANLAYQRDLCLEAH